MNITLKQARELRAALMEKSPELLDSWKKILKPEEVEDKETEEASVEE